MIIERKLGPHILRSLEMYPVVSVTGPRQSGKTTLIREVLSDWRYVNFELPENRAFAEEDPKRLLREYSEKTIFDEIQNVPEFVSYIQVHVDEVGKNAMFVLTGSEQLRISNTISQSLAGRTAILRLLPLSIEELSQTGMLSSDIDELLYKGFYPRVYLSSGSPSQLLGDYLETYIERDVRRLAEIRNLSQFRKFVRLCAGRVGQVLNVSSLGADAGITHTTAGEWLSLLEASYVLYRLPPFFRNISKRLVKSPKLYFYDVGLATYLCGVNEKIQLANHPLRGNLFENLVVSEILKYRFNHRLRDDLFFYRDSKKQEVDVLYPTAGKYLAIEVKASETFHSEFLKSLKNFSDTFPDECEARFLVCGGSETYARSDTTVTNPFHLYKELEARSE